MIENQSDVDKVQSDLDKLATWSETWQLKFNASKCKCMHFGKENPENKYYMMEDNVKIDIENIKSEKDLGVFFDNELKFNEHIAIKVKKANQALGMIRNTFSCLDKEIFLPLYKSFVRPHLEYASVIWSPTYKKDIISIEHVQRRATKLVTGMKNLPYENRTKILGLPTLYYRRERADMLQLFKIMNNYDNIDIKNIDRNSNTNTRGHSQKLNKKRSKSRFGQNRFSNRIVNNWNILSEDTVTAKSINIFKSGINSDWKNRPLKFQPIN